MTSQSDEIHRQGVGGSAILIILLRKSHTLLCAVDGVEQALW